MTLVPLPSITHLQFLVLSLVDGQTRCGQSIRDQLSAVGAKKSDPAFYQLMARMEEAGLVLGRYETHVVAGQTIKERKYEILPAGHRAVREVLEFYASRTSGRKQPTDETLKDGLPTGNRGRSAKSVHR